MGLPNRCQIMNDKIIDNSEQSKLLYMETYGCQMNVADSEVVYAIMETIGYGMTERMGGMADVVFLNTCSVARQRRAKGD